MKRGIILDTNCFSHVFDENDALHSEFSPVKEWLNQNKGVLVFGGSKYLKELAKAKTYLKLFNRLKDMGIAVRVNDTIVDSEEARIKSLMPIADFDDPHLPAIVIVSGCRVICSQDKRCFPYLKNNMLYPKAGLRPKFYSQKQNRSLLYSKYTIF